MTSGLFSHSLGHERMFNPAQKTRHLGGSLLTVGAAHNLRLRLARPNPKRPMPNRARVLGSGTEAVRNEYSPSIRPLELSRDILPPLKIASRTPPPQVTVKSLRKLSATVGSISPRLLPLKGQVSQAVSVKLNGPIAPVILTVRFE